MTARRHGAVAAVVLGLACVLLVVVPGTRGALTGTVRNSTNTAASAAYDRCTTTSASAAGAVFVMPFHETAGTTAADLSGNSRPGTYNGGVTLNQSGPCAGGGGRSVLLDGTSGFVHNPSLQTNPQTFSVQVWFRTSGSLLGTGRLAGFGDGAGTTRSGSYDRHVYMTATGRLTFGVYPNAVRTVTSPAAYADGAWHHVVATLAPSGNANPGMRLYVDGALVASDPATTSAQVYAGYWRFGWDNLATWPGADVLGQHYFRGNVAYGSVWSTALTPAQVSALYAART